MPSTTRELAEAAPGGGYGPTRSAAVLFGVGWGLVGFCPGPAIASLAFGLKESFIFVAAMSAGAWLHNALGSET